MAANGAIGAGSPSRESTIGSSRTFQAPMEWDFHANGGMNSFADHGGFDALDGAKNPIPDTMAQPVPKHGTIFLLGGGLLGIGVWGLRRERMRK
jgi:hypothetical protein